MSVIFECDRCHKTTKFECTMRLWEKERGLWGHSYDLCKKCFKDMEVFMNLKYIPGGQGEL